jgi:hypothetical protein
MAIFSLNKISRLVPKSQNRVGSPYYAQGGVVTAYSRGHVDWRSLNGVQSRGTIKSGTRYFLSNKLGALDTGGEWYYGSNTLYLWTPNSDNPSSHTVEAKRRMFAFDLNGRSNTTIKEFNIFAASIDMDTSSSGNVIDGINAKYVWHQTRNVPVGINQTDSKWGAWNTGIRLAGSNNVLKNCTIAFSSNNGVYVRNTHQTVTNCIIHDIAYGKVEGGAVSWMGDDAYGGNTQGHEVTHNTMYTSGRAIVNHYYAPNIKIQHNLMYDACIQTADCGITYTNKGGSSGDISYNVLHDDHADFFAFALYLDDGSENYTVHHNVIYNSDDCGITNNGASSDLLYNNTLYNTRLGICKKLF